jgi:hypothetical protein
MRVRFMLALASAIIGFGAKTFFNGRSTDRAGLITKAMAASNTLSPYEIPVLELRASKSSSG